MKREFVFLFILFSILTFGNLSNLCHQYFPLLFDNQILLSWQYWAEKGLLPYRDIYYQYGILFFYKGVNLFFGIMYYFITPLILICVYSGFKKIFRSPLLSFGSTFFLLAFVAKFVGYEIFTRYGIVVGFLFVLAQILFAYHKTFPTKKIFLLGAVNGLIFVLLNDSGIYALAVSIGLLVVDTLARESWLRMKNVLALFKNILKFVAGFLVGIAPYLIYLSLNNSLNRFISSFLEYSDLQLLAKTPFFHGILTLDNIFVLSILFITLSMLSYGIYKDAKSTLVSYLQIGVALLLIILEQKSIWRHIDGQLIFLGLILCVLLFAQFFEKLKSMRLIVFTSFIVVSLVLIFSPFKHTALNLKESTCQQQFDIKSEKHLRVKKYLDAKRDFGGKVFSFPADTIFYILFGNKPPYYPTSFEGSSKKGQERLISYIKNENIQYVIYNYKNLAVQDGLPNYVRTPELNKYILNNFEIDKVLGDFLILKRGLSDFLKDGKLNDLAEFKNYLLNVNLENIPRSEGMYKRDNLREQDRLVGGSIENINKYFKINSVPSNMKLLVLKSEGLNKTNTEIDIKTKDGLRTKVMFKNCEEGIVCIINLSHLPIFYKNRILESISSNNDVLNVGLYSDQPIFW